MCLFYTRFFDLSIFFFSFCKFFYFAVDTLHGYPFICGIGTLRYYRKKSGVRVFLLPTIRLLYNPCVMNCLPVYVLFGVLYFAVSSWLFENKLEL